MKGVIAVLLAASVFACGVCFGADEPMDNLEMKQMRPQPRVSAAPASQQPPPPFYGYVPPAPIRHTWPGGYKVIIHEMMNTLASHILGQY